jgi:hypothetical protein
MPFEQVPKELIQVLCLFVSINNPSRCIQPGAVFKPAENYSTGRKQSIYSDEWCKKDNSRETPLSTLPPQL